MYMDQSVRKGSFYFTITNKLLMLGFSLSTASLVFPVYHLSFVLNTRNRNIKFIFLQIRLNVNFINVRFWPAVEVFQIIFVSRDSSRWTQQPPPRRSTWLTCRSTAMRTQHTNISRHHPPKVFCPQGERRESSSRPMRTFKTILKL